MLSIMAPCTGTAAGGRTPSKLVPTGCLPQGNARLAEPGVALPPAVIHAAERRAAAAPYSRGALPPPRT